MQWKWMLLGGVVLGLAVAVVFLSAAVESSIVALLGSISADPSGGEPPPVLEAAPSTIRTGPAPTAPAIELPPPARQESAPSSAQGLASINRPDTHRGRKRGASASRILGGQIAAALAPLRPRLASCSETAMQGGFGGSAGTADAPSEQRILLLDVSTLDGKVEILDASSAMPQPGSEAFVGCARGVLQGQIVSVPAVKAGERVRVVVEIVPTPSQRPEELLEQVRRQIDAEIPARR